jgi:predicted transcriptional regulator
MNNTEQSNDLLALTTEIVAAHVSNNTVALGDLPQLINQVYNSLANIGVAPAAPAAPPQPAVSVKKSVQPDYIVCLEDGKKLKMLKRHLKTAYNMSPEAYRERWGLSPVYPMVAPNYARQRSHLAKEIGLGTRARLNLYRYPNESLVIPAASGIAVLYSTVAAVCHSRLGKPGNDP